MSDEKKENQSSLKRWFMMFIFPPYGMYYFLFKSKVRWLLKIPISLILILVMILSIDQTVNPYRVEESQVQKSIVEYINENPNMKLGSLRAIDRQGAFTWKQEAHLVYRTLTTKGLYDFVMIPDGTNTFKVNAVYQTHPIEIWKNEEYENLYPAEPMAMLYFYEQHEVLGDLKDVKKEGEINLMETTKGTYRYIFDKNKVVSVINEDGKEILQQKNEYNLPKEAEKYFKKNEDDLGKIIKIYDYDMDKEKEMFFVRTEKGNYRVDDYRNGNMELMKQEIKQ